MWQIVAGELTSGRKVHPIRERKPDILKSCGGCLPHRERACVGVAFQARGRERQVAPAGSTKTEE